MEGQWWQMQMWLCWDGRETGKQCCGLGNILLCTEQRKKLEKNESPDVPKGGSATLILPNATV